MNPTLADILRRLSLLAARDEARRRPAADDLEVEQPDLNSGEPREHVEGIDVEELDRWRETAQSIDVEPGSADEQAAETIYDLLDQMQQRADYGQLTIADVEVADRIVHSEVGDDPAVAQAAEGIVEESIEARIEYGYGYDPEDVGPHRRVDWDAVHANAPHL